MISNSLARHWFNLYCSFSSFTITMISSTYNSPLSSTAAEFQAMVQGICELLWLEDLKIKCNELMSLYCDNKSAIRILSNGLRNMWIVITDDYTGRLKDKVQWTYEVISWQLICNQHSSQSCTADGTEHIEVDRKFIKEKLDLHPVCLLKDSLHTYSPRGWIALTLRELYPNYK